MAGQGTRGTFAAIVIGLAVGLVIGLVNGIGIGVFGVNPLIMTLGVATVTLGFLTVGAQTFVSGVPLVPHAINVIGSGRLFGYIPYDLFVWAPVAAAIILGLRYSGYGRMLYAVGDNPPAMRLAGVRIWQVLVAAYLVCGMLSAVAGILLVGYTNAADLGLASSYLLPSVAAVVIGGTSILGGSGGYSGTILGALILTVLDSLLTLLNAGQAAKQMLYGGIILALAWLYARTAGGE
jgi:ribose transport system permease protein